MSASVSLRGGSDSIAAELDELVAFAAALRRTSGPLGEDAAVVARLLSDPALVPAGVLDPMGAAEVAVGASLALARITATALACEALAEAVRAAAAAYRVADDLDAQARPVLRALVHLPGVPALGPHTVRSPQALLSADPALAAVAVDAISALGAGGVAAPVATTWVAALLATPYRDGTPVVTARAGRPTDDASGPPRCSADLIRTLAVRDRDDDGGGAIDIRFLTAPPGPTPAGTPTGTSGRRVIVNITGTTAWNLDPRHATPQVSDTSTNLRTLANQSSVFERGVILALRQAGVRPDEPIMLVGHSQGGMVAARLAGDLTTHHQFLVTHLVTAGSPIGLAAIPAGISVLSLENRGDVVPELDGRDNPARASWLTASTDHGAASVLAKHSLDAYLAGAGDLDADDDPSLTSWRAGAQLFLSAGQVSTAVFQVRRG